MPRLDELVRHRVAAMNVLDLGIAESGLYMIHTKVLARRSIRTENVATAHDWQSISTCDTSVAGRGAQSLIDDVGVRVSRRLDVLAVIVCNNTIRTFLLH